MHYAVYLAEVGCKKAAAANVESVFSGAGKFTKEAPTVGAKLLQRMVKLNNNWKYKFLRPTMAKIIERYNLKFKYQDVTLPLRLRASARRRRP